jgi:hypothetical protein
MIHFDHFEIHVGDSANYVLFLQKLFSGGRYKLISENSTYMFLTPDGIRIEIKQNSLYENIFSIDSGIGVCLPCLRTTGAKKHLDDLGQITITKIIHNPDGDVYFFKDYEQIDWHFKDYNILDVYVNI